MRIRIVYDRDCIVGIAIGLFGRIKRSLAPAFARSHHGANWGRGDFALHCNALRNRGGICRKIIFFCSRGILRPVLNLRFGAKLSEGGLGIGRKSMREKKGGGWGDVMIKSPHKPRGVNFFFHKRFFCSWYIYIFACLFFFLLL